jgi:hypothetical protein
VVGWRAIESARKAIPESALMAVKVDTGFAQVLVVFNGGAEIHTAARRVQRALRFVTSPTRKEIQTAFGFQYLFKDYYKEQFSIIW